MPTAFMFSGGLSAFLVNRPNPMASMGGGVTGLQHVVLPPSHGLGRGSPYGRTTFFSARGEMKWECDSKRPPRPHRCVSAWDCFHGARPAPNGPDAEDDRGRQRTTTGSLTNSARRTTLRTVPCPQPIRKPVAKKISPPGGVGKKKKKKKKPRPPGGPPPPPFKVFFYFRLQRFRAAPNQLTEAVRHATPMVLTAASIAFLK